MSYLVSTIEAEEARVERAETTERLAAEEVRASSFEDALSARLVASDTKHTDKSERLTEEVRAIAATQESEGTLLKAAVEQNRNEIVLTGSRHTRMLEEEREERMNGVEENELLSREIERATQEAEVRTVLSQMISTVEHASHVEHAANRHAALTTTVRDLAKTSSERIEEVDSSANTELAAVRLVQATAEASMLGRLEEEVTAARSDADAALGTLRSEHVDKIDALGSAVRAELQQTRVDFDVETDKKIRAQLVAAEEKEACEEAVQRMIEALEERELYDADAARREQFKHMQTELDVRAKAEAEAKEAAMEDAAKRQSDMESQVVNLSVKLDGATASFEEMIKAEGDALRGTSEEMKTVCFEEVDKLKSLVDEKNEASEKKVADAEARAEVAETTAKEAQASVAALREGLGLGGLGVDGDNGRLVAAAELAELRTRVEAEIARVSAQLAEAQSDFAGASVELRRTAEEARVLKADRLEQEADDARKDADKERAARGEAEASARKVAADAEASVAEAKDQAAAERKRAEAEDLRRRQAEYREKEASKEAAEAREASAAKPPAAAAPPPEEEPAPFEAPAAEPEATGEAAPAPAED
jgi:hypothetical protein